MTIQTIALSFALLGVGCAGMDDGYEPSGGTADDLLGRKVWILPSGSPISIEPYKDTVAHPTVEDDEESVTIRTEDFRYEMPAAGDGYLWVEQPTDGGSLYAFELQYAAPGSNVWESLTENIGNNHVSDNYLRRYFWSSLKLGYESDEQMVVTGTAIRVTEGQGGDAPDWHAESIEALERFPKDSELRVMVVPVWDYWLWDDDGYTPVLKNSVQDGTH
jgi:hypothetical protein